jgi:hypothetical protein
MNVPAVANFLGQYVAFFNNMVVAQTAIPILIGLVAMIKVKAAAAIVGGHGSVGEKLGHAALIGLLIAIAPFVFPFVAPHLPSYLSM